MVGMTRLQRRTSWSCKIVSTRRLRVLSHGTRAITTPANAGWDPPRSRGVAAGPEPPPGRGGDHGPVVGAQRRRRQEGPPPGRLGRVPARRVARSRELAATPPPSIEGAARPAASAAASSFTDEAGRRPPPGTRPRNVGDRRPRMAPHVVHDRGLEPGERERVVAPGIARGKRHRGPVIADARRARSYRGAAGVAEAEDGVRPCRRPRPRRRRRPSRRRRGTARRPSTITTMVCPPDTRSTARPVRDPAPPGVLVSKCASRWFTPTYGRSAASAIALAAISTVLSNAPADRGRGTPPPRPTPGSRPPTPPAPPRSPR